VIEMGNTEMTKYMAAAPSRTCPRRSRRSKLASTWLEGLALSGATTGSCTESPTTPARASCTYRTDLWNKAGLKVPKTSAQFTADAKKLNSKFGKKGFSPVYIAGTDWYCRDGLRLRLRRQIATRISGKWKGALASPKSIAGLTAFKNFFNAASQASKTTIETRPNPYDVYAQGMAASIVGPSWFSCCVGKQYTAGRAVRHAEPHAGQGHAGLPRRLRPRRAGRRRQGRWRPTGSRLFTDTATEKGLQAKGNIPNTTSLFKATKINERAASRSWFVPTAKNWVNVENGNILRNMLSQILTGKLTVKQAAQAASDNIASVLNAK
jgi:N,N'-diacetylchitobiose transport system substrate-binding protein